MNRGTCPTWGPRPRSRLNGTDPNIQIRFETHLKEKYVLLGVEEFVDKRCS